MRIPIHSTTDLITNSSTTIFTYSQSSERAIVELIDEFFKAFLLPYKCEDVFDTVVLSDSYSFEDAVENELAPEGMTKDEVMQLYEDVKTGKAKKPDWFKNIEEQEDSWNYYTPSTYLHLIPKKEEYAQLATLISKFLYSTDHEASHD